MAGPVLVLPDVLRAALDAVDPHVPAFGEIPADRPTGTFAVVDVVSSTRRNVVQSDATVVVDIWGTDTTEVWNAATLVHGHLGAATRETYAGVMVDGARQGFGPIRDYDESTKLHRAQISVRWTVSLLAL